MDTQGAGLNFLKSVSIQSGFWRALEPIELQSDDNSSSSRKKEKEQYSSYKIIVTSKPIKHFIISVGLPYIRVNEEINSMERSTGSIGDVEMNLKWQKKQWELSTGFLIPSGYENDIDSLWISSGSMVLKPALGYNKYIDDLKVSVGLKVYSSYYLNNQRVGWGSWEAGISGYYVKILKIGAFGGELSMGRKSLSFYQWGTKFQQTIKGYGEPFEQTESLVGLFYSAKIVKQVGLSLGIKRTLLRVQSPVGISGWLEVKYQFDE